MKQMKYFSDKEQGMPPRTLTEINVAIWNGIVLIINEFIANASLAASFPARCDDSGEICGCDEVALGDGIKSIIPNLGMGLNRLTEPIVSPFGIDIKAQDINTYAVLDLVEYIHHNIKDVRQIGNYHTFFKHYHYCIDDRGTNRKVFQEKINELFERNGLNYTLTDAGQIERVVPLPLNLIIHRVVTTKDPELNRLVSDAAGKIRLPKLEDRKLALDKLWDAFERSKTYFLEDGKVDKRKSVDRVLDKLSGNDVNFRLLLNNECLALTKIGNDFQIRHYEKGKIAIENSDEIDYLFYRMFSYINLFSKCIN